MVLDSSAGVVVLAHSRKRDVARSSLSQRPSESESAFASWPDARRTGAFVEAVAPGPTADHTRPERLARTRAPATARTNRVRVHTGLGGFSAILAPRDRARSP